MESLAEILSGTTAPDTSANQTPTAEPAQATDVKTTAAPAVEAPATSAGQATETKEGETADPNAPAQVRDENGRFVKREEVTALRTAMQEERRKRQALEQRIAESTDTTPKPTIWEDPDAFVDGKVAKVKEESDARFYSLSERLAKQQHTDFDETVNALLADCETDPSLGKIVYQHIHGAEHPAEELYRYAANRREMKVAGGDLGKYVETHTTPLKQQNAELTAENARLKAQLENLSKVPSSLTAEPSASRAQVASDAANTTESLDEILAPRTKRRA